MSTVLEEWLKFTITVLTHDWTVIMIFILALNLTNSTHLWLEIPEAEQTKIWGQSQAFSTSNRRWIAYLNRLRLNAFLPWLRKEHAPNATAFPTIALTRAFGKLMVQVFPGNDTELLIPTEAADLRRTARSSRMGGYS